MTVSWYMSHASADAALTASRRLRAASIDPCIAMLADLPFQGDDVRLQNAFKNIM